MEASLGVRVVRGPDWCWEDQDGGEGCVGTVVEVGDEGRSVLVQWDCGIRSWYRSGEEGKFDLRVLDTAPTGMSFPDIICSGCYVEGVAGMHWQCAHCYEYHLCHSCYLLGRHCQEHPFFRVQSKKQSRRIMMSSRADAKKVVAKGIFPGAEVVRGPHWRFEDQDGGAGNPGRVVAIEGWQGQTARSVARIEWNVAGTQTNVYRVGHRGKVDILCRSTSYGDCYFPEHLPLLGASLSSVFNEDEIVAGDLVMVDLDPDMFKMMHDGSNLWVDSMFELVCQTGVVLVVVESRRVVACFSEKTFIVCYDAVSKLKYCRVGMDVRVTDTIEELHRLQNEFNLWNQGLVATMGQIGRVIKIAFNSRVQVAIGDMIWIFNPLCLHQPSPTDAIPEISDKKVDDPGIIRNWIRADYEDAIRQSGYSDDIVNGDVTALSSYLLNNSHWPAESDQGSHFQGMLPFEMLKTEKIDILMMYYSVTGNIPAMKLLLDNGINPNLTIEGRAPGPIGCLIANREKAAQTLLEAGASANCSVESLALVMFSASYASPAFTKFLVSRPDLFIDTLDETGETALHLGGKYCKNINMAVMLAAGADPKVNADSAMHEAARAGYISVMEVFVVQVPQHLGFRNHEGWTPLHFAANSNHTRLVNLLAPQNTVDVDTLTNQHSTALHIAAWKGYCHVIECLVGWGAALDIGDQMGNTPLLLIVLGKLPMFTDSPRLNKIQNDLLRLSKGRAVEGYITLVCFLASEGASMTAVSHKGLSPSTVLPTESAALVTTYVKNNPGSFRGSLRSYRHLRTQRELPARMTLPVQAQQSSAGATPDMPVGAGSGAAPLPMKDMKEMESYLPPSDPKTVFIAKGTKSKDVQKGEIEYTKKDLHVGAAAKGKQPLPLHDAATLQPTPTSQAATVAPGLEASEATASGEMTVSSQVPTTQFRQTIFYSKTSSGSSQPDLSHVCMLCEEGPPCVKFSPCGHVVFCSDCAELATKCLKCKAPVLLKTNAISGL